MYDYILVPCLPPQMLILLLFDISKIWYWFRVISACALNKCNATTFNVTVQQYTMTKGNKELRV